MRFKTLSLFALLLCFSLPGVSAALDDDVVSAWTMNNADLSGSTVIDSAGTQNGTVTGATTGVTGILEQAFNYSGADNNITFPSNAAWDTANWSMSIWFNSELAATEQFVIHRDVTGGSEADWSLSLEADNTLDFEFFDVGTQTLSTGALNTGQWYQVIIVAEDGNQSFYLNGSLVTATARSLDWSLNGNNLQTAMFSSGALPYSGLIDEIVFWNRTLNTSEVTELYADGVGIGYPFVNEINITLLLPIDSDILSDQPVNFSYNITTLGGTADNVTLFINGTANKTVTSVVDGVNNITIEMAEGEWSWYLSGWFNGNNTITDTRTLRVVRVNNTLIFNIANEVNEDIITGVNIFVNLISDTINESANTTVGLVSFGNITPENYTVRVTAIGWGLRDNFITVTNTSNLNRTLFLLNDSFRGSLIITVEDSRTNKLSGAIVKLLRYYGSCNCYEEVESAVTTSDGTRTMSVQLLDAFYRFVVEYQGTTELITTEPINFAPGIDGIARQTLTIDIGNNFYDSYTGLTGVTSVVLYNNVTETLSYTWNDPSGLTLEGCLSARYARGVAWVLFPESCVSGAAGSVLLTLQNTTNTTYLWTAFRNTDSAFSPPIDDNGALEPLDVFFLGSLGTLLFIGVYIGGAILFSFNAIAVILWTSLILISNTIIGLTGVSLLPLGLSFTIAFVSLTLGLAIFLFKRQ